MDIVLEELANFIEYVNETNSGNDKIAALKTANKDIQKLLKYVYNDSKTLGVTSSNCIKNKGLAFSADECASQCDTTLTLVKLFDLLSSREYTGSAAIKLVNSFVAQNEGFERLIFDCIDRDLKCGVSKTSINKAFPNLIPEFKCSLAATFEKDTSKKIDLSKYVILRKLDGVRCITFISENSCRFFSRTGKEFETLDLLKQDLLKFFKGIKETFVIDGELCIMDGEKELFSSIVSEVRKKGHIIKNPFYKIFDFMTEEQFYGHEESMRYRARLRHAEYHLRDDTEYFSVLQGIRFTEDNFEMMKEQSKTEGWEGLILRKNAPYKSGRSKDLLKYKLFLEGEYEVQGTVIGNKQMLVDKQMKDLDCISALIIVHKGNVVQVGSGLTDEERINWYEDPDRIVGKIITVKYFEESENQEGGLSLRFPTLKAVHGSKREV